MDIPDSIVCELRDLIFNKRQVVTYKWLSRHLGEHANTFNKSKRILHQFYQLCKDEKPQFPLNVTYLICGTIKCKDHTESRTMLVSGDNLESIKKEYSSVADCHLFSIKFSKLRMAAELAVLDDDCNGQYLDSDVKLSHVQVVPNHNEHQLYLSAKEKQKITSDGGKRKVEVKFADPPVSQLCKTPAKQISSSIIKKESKVEESPDQNGQDGKNSVKKDKQKKNRTKSVKPDSVLNPQSQDKDGLSEDVSIRRSEREKSGHSLFNLVSFNSNDLFSTGLSSPETSPVKEHFALKSSMETKRKKKPAASKTIENDNDNKDTTETASVQPCGDSDNDEGNEFVRAKTKSSKKKKPSSETDGSLNGNNSKIDRFVVSSQPTQNETKSATAFAPKCTTFLDADGYMVTTTQWKPEACSNSEDDSKAVARNTEVGDNCALTLNSQHTTQSSVDSKKRDVIKTSKNTSSKHVGSGTQTTLTSFFAKKPQKPP